MNESKSPLRLIGMLALLAGLVWLLAGVFGEGSREIAAPGEALPNASATSDDLPPSPLPPTDDGVRMVPCCTQFPVDVNSLSPEQATALAQLPPPQQITPQPTWDGTIPPDELYLPGIYLTPSAEWAVYKDPTFGYSFEYPANYSASFVGDTQVHNHLYDGKPRVYDTSHPENFIVVIGTPKKRSPDQSLEEYVGGIQHDPDWVLVEQSAIKLRHGYTGIKQVFKQPSGPLFILVRIEHGDLIYVLDTYDSAYSAVFDRLLDSMVLP